MHPDAGYNNFLKIYEEYHDKKESFNEADTRAKIIDYILRDCLGWPEKNIRREESVESGRIDYLLAYQDVPLLVIEAKKGGEYFEIPVSMNNRRYKISGSISTVGNLNKALEHSHRRQIEQGIADVRFPLSYFDKDAHACRAHDPGQDRASLAGRWFLVVFAIPGYLFHKFWTSRNQATGS